MPSYVILGKWTEQGAKSVKETLNRAQRFQEMVQKEGGRVTSLNWTQGSYDVVATFEVPSEQSATTIALQLGTQGSIRTETLRAYSADEMKQILSKLP